MKKPLAGIAGVLLMTVLLAGCGKAVMNHEGMSGSPEHGEHTGHEMETRDTSGIRAGFTWSVEKPQAKQDARLSIQITDNTGKPVEKFDVSHEKQMHLIVVSKDLSYFNHIHPDYKGKGVFEVAAQFPSGGEYELIADFVPSGLGDMNRSQWTTVQGAVPTLQPIEPDAGLTKVVDGKEVTLTFDHLMASMELGLNFHLKDAQTKKDVTDLQPYLGSVGHVVILSQDGSNYLHVHPVDEKAKGPDAKFMTTFPHSGVYKIWGQFQQGGKVFTVPFVVKVP